MIDCGRLFHTLTPVMAKI